MRTRVHFDVVITVNHKDAKALKKAVASFINCPAHECISSEGFFYRTGKPRLLKRSPPQTEAAPFKEALDLLEMCDGCDLHYDAWPGLGTDPDTDQSSVSDHVRAFLKKHGRGSCLLPQET